MIESLGLLTELSNRNVRYLLCGGLAVNIYGIPRVTADIDLVLDLKEENIENFVTILKEQNYIKSLPIELHALVDNAYREKLVKDNNLIAYSFHSTLRSVTILDVIVDCPYSFEKMWDKREVRNTSKGDVFVISIEHLIGMKKVANRIQDKKDIEALLKLNKS